MNLYTIQMAKWRKAKSLDIPFLDTTVKSGNKAFAPTWEMVKGHKEGTLSDEEYSILYRKMMIQSFHRNRQEWMNVIEKGVVAIACYCPAGAFCHRHLLASFFNEVCTHRSIPFENKGEIE